MRVTILLIILITTSCAVQKESNEVAYQEGYRQGQLDLWKDNAFAEEYGRIHSLEENYKAGFDDGRYACQMELVNMIWGEKK